METINATCKRTVVVKRRADARTSPPRPGARHTMTMTMAAAVNAFLLLVVASSSFDVTLSFHSLAFITTTHASRFNSNKNARGKKSTAIFALPELLASSLPLLAPSSSAAVDGHGVSLISPQVLTEFASAAMTYLSLIAYFDRPRGSLTIPNVESTLQVRPSHVPNAGLGLFTTQSLSKGTILGTYPGVLRPANTFYDGKGRNFPQAIGYSWRFTDNKYVIDPTDSQGNIQDVCLGGSSEVPFSNTIFSTIFQTWKVNTALCRINEPPIGVGGCNVSARENLDTREVVFELIQDVVPGQELYLDYGLTYDRSMYG